MSHRPLVFLLVLLSCSLVSAEELNPGRYKTTVSFEGKIGGSELAGSD